MVSKVEPQREQNNLRALRGDKLFDHEGREVHEGRDTKLNAEGAENQFFVCRRLQRTKKFLKLKL